MLVQVTYLKNLHFIMETDILDAQICPLKKDRTQRLTIEMKMK